MPSASGGGSGFTPIGCVATLAATDIHAAGAHDLLIGGIVDNVWDFNPLAAIPAGLGFTFAFNGTSALLATTRPGTWAITVAISFTTGVDATLAGFVSGGLSGSGNEFAKPNSTVGLVCFCEVLTLPSGASGVYVIETVTPATSNPYNVSGTLSIVRLA